MNENVVLEPQQPAFADALLDERREVLAQATPSPLEAWALLRRAAVLAALDALVAG